MYQVHVLARSSVMSDERRATCRTNAVVSESQTSTAVSGLGLELFYGTPSPGAFPSTTFNAPSGLFVVRRPLSIGNSYKCIPGTGYQVCLVPQDIKARCSVKRGRAVCPGGVCVLHIKPFFLPRYDLKSYASGLRPIVRVWCFVLRA